MADKSYKSTLFKRAIDLGKITVGVGTDLVKVWRTSTGEEKAISLSDIAGGLIGDYVPYTGATDDVNLGEYGLSTGYIRFDTTPTNTPTEQGTTYWDVDDNTLAIIMNGAIQKVGEDSFYPVKNQTGSTILKGRNVRFAGSLGSSGRLLIAPFLADGTYRSSFYMGVTMEDIEDGEDGKVMWFGRIRGINTNDFNANDTLYVSTTSAGGFQTTIPESPNNIIEVCAVINKSTTNGVIFVRPTIAPKITEIEGVKIVSPTTGDLLQLQSGGLWENKSVATIIGSAYVPSTRELTINGTTFNLSANRTWNVGTVTSVGVSVPTGLTVANSPVIGSGTIAISLQSGYSIPTTAKQTEWDTAYSNRISSLTTTGSSGAATLISNTLNIPNYTLSGLGGVPTSRTLTINGTALDLSANRSWSVGTVTSVGALTIGTTGTDISSSVANGTTTPVITLNIPTASATNRGVLSSADWTTFNNKQNALTNPVTGTGTTNQLAYFTGASTIASLTTATYPSLTELSYVKGVTSAIQTQLNNRQPLATNLTSLAGLTFASTSFVKMTAGGTFALDTNTYLTGNQSISLTGDATGSGTTSIAVTLANSGVTAGTYRSVTVDVKGRVTAGANPTTIAGYGITDFYAQVVSGFVTGANSTVLNTDSLEVALEKLQGQVNARISGNQTITLSGDVTGSGTTAITATIANNAVTTVKILDANVTYAKIQNVTANRILGRVTTSGIAQELTASEVRTLLNVADGATANTGTVTSVSFTIGTSGNDVNSSVVSSTISPTITLNIPTASATNRGLLSTTDWTTFNGKQNALALTTTGASGASTLVGSTLNVPTYTLAGLGGVPTSRTITINGTALDLSANRSYSVGTVTSVGLSSATTGVTVGSTPVTTSGTITIAIATASGSQQGLLSSTDWTTFNNKQNALTNPVTGTGANGQVSFWSGTNSQGGDSSFFWDNTNKRLGVGTQVFAFSPRLAVASVGQNSIAIQTTDTVQGSAGTILYLGTGASTGNSTFGVIVPLGNGGTVAANLVLQPSASNGNVLIATSTDNGARLQVNGGATLVGNVILDSSANRTIGLGTGASNARITFGSAGGMVVNVATGTNVSFERASGNFVTFTGAGIRTYFGGVQTTNPYNGTADVWYLGDVVSTGTSTPDRWIRIQIGGSYYEILAVYGGDVPS